MQTIQTFDFATVVCDGCARRLDSQFDGERLYDYAELTEWKLDDLDWQKVDEKDYDRWLCPDCAKDEEHRKHPGEGRIIVEPEPLYGLRCDLCGKTFEDFEGYSCWEDEDVAEEHAREDYWMEIGGKWYCPDCYCDCPAIEDDGMDDWDEAKKRYCAKCPYEKDCSEVVPLAHPHCSDECKYAFKGEDGNWKRCAYYKECETKTLHPHECRLIANGGDECPRVAYWRDKGKAEQEAKNAKARKECRIEQ